MLATFTTYRVDVITLIDYREKHSIINNVNHQFNVFNMERQFLLKYRKSSTID